MSIAYDPMFFANYLALLYIILDLLYFYKFYKKFYPESFINCFADCAANYFELRAFLAIYAYLLPSIELYP